MPRDSGGLAAREELTPGKNFEEGLANLDTAAQAEAPKLEARAPSLEAVPALAH